MIRSECRWRAAVYCDVCGVQCANAEGGWTALGGYALHEEVNQAMKAQHVASLRIGRATLEEVCEACHLAIAALVRHPAPPSEPEVPY